MDPITAAERPEAIFGSQFWTPITASPACFLFYFCFLDPNYGTHFFIFSVCTLKFVLVHVPSMLYVKYVIRIYCIWTWARSNRISLYLGDPIVSWLTLTGPIYIPIQTRPHRDRRVLSSNYSIDQVSTCDVNEHKTQERPRC